MNVLANRSVLVAAIGLVLSATAWPLLESAAHASDLDLFIIQDSEMSNREMRRRIEYLLWGRRFGVDLIVRRPEEVERNVADGNPFYTHHILEEGQVLYERPS